MPTPTPLSVDYGPEVATANDRHEIVKHATRVPRLGLTSEDVAFYLVRPGGNRSTDRGVGLLAYLRRSLKLQLAKSMRRE
jgi:hypothetical protein